MQSDSCRERRRGRRKLRLGRCFLRVVGVEDGALMRWCCVVISSGDILLAVSSVRRTLPTIYSMGHLSSDDAFSESLQSHNAMHHPHSGCCMVDALPLPST